jgi:transposase InsO family protein
VPWSEPAKEDTLQLAISLRGKDIDDAIFHTDPGSQFTYRRVVELREKNGIVRQWVKRYLVTITQQRSRSGQSSNTRIYIGMTLKICPS